MNVRIIRLSGFRSIDSRIIRSTGLALPTFGDGWRFNFEKHARNASLQCYVLVTEDAPDVVEGCLIFRLKNAMEPYMACIEMERDNDGNIAGGRRKTDY